MRLLVIDGNSIANRAFFGIKLLTTKDGRYTNAIYGFLNILLSLLKECEPDEVAVAFDPKAGKRMIFLARWPLPAPPERTTASLLRETGTACSWSVTPPLCCLPPLSWDAARR